MYIQTFPGLEVSMDDQPDNLRDGLPHRTSMVLAGRDFMRKGSHGRIEPTEVEITAGTSVENCYITPVDMQHT